MEGTPVPAHRRHLARDRRHRLDLLLEQHDPSVCSPAPRPHHPARPHLHGIGSGTHDAFAIWLPGADDPLHLDSFGDVAAFAFDCADLPVEREVLVLLDEDRRVTAALLDPPPPLGVFIGRTDIPGLEVDFSQTLSIVFVDTVRDDPVPAEDVEGYQALRRLHLLQGLFLLDVVLVDDDRACSLSLATDPDPVW